MRYFVLSDIHSNIEALDACITQAQVARYDRVLCCGDIVGYGPNPIEVIDRIVQLEATCIRGNHDRVSSGLEEPTEFNLYARQAVYWTRAQLSENYRQQLADLPMGPLPVENAQLVHGSLTDEDDYLITDGDAEMNLELAGTRITFFGHTHEAIVFVDHGDQMSTWIPDYAADAATLQISGRKLLVNPGSVGQPRDGDWRASFLVWDTEAETLEFYRVEYPVEQTQEKMRRA